MENPTLVLLPGFDGTGKFFAPLIEHVSAFTDVVTPSYPHDQLSYEQLCQFVCSKLPIDRKFVVIGESFSGPVAINLASAKPPGLVGVVLVATFAKNPFPLVPKLISSGTSILEYVKVPKQAIKYLLLGGNDCGLVSEIQETVSGLSSAVVASRLQNVLCCDVRRQLAAISVPTLLIEAGRDRLMPQSATALLRKCLPTAHSAVIDGPHLVLQVAPAESADVIQKFCAQIAC